MDQSESGIAHEKAEFIGYVPEPIRIDFEQLQYFYDVIEFKNTFKSTNGKCAK